MKKVRILGLLAVGVLFASGCEQPAPAHSHAELEDLAELRIEIEQLTNAVGRLEFRIYELENHHPDTQNESNNEAATESAPAASQTAAGDKRYDLTPAE